MQTDNNEPLYQYLVNENSQLLPSGYMLHEFKILSLLGKGGFGITYLAEDTNLKLQVAIKEFFPSDLAVRDSSTGSVYPKGITFVSEFKWGISRFSQEAQTLARFHHPNIVHVFRFFEANGTCYMVMDYEDGESLVELLSLDSIKWTEEYILELFKPLLDGVSHIHQAGFLHRDFNPSNIYIRKKDGSPVLLDFGSARAALNGHAQKLTAMVTPGYCPLEQYSDESTQGAWTDIYSIGAVIYRVVAGKPPPQATSRIKKDPMVPMIFAGHQRYSPGFLRAIDQALCMDEEKRPQSIAEWLPQLEGHIPSDSPSDKKLSGSYKAIEEFMNERDAKILADIQWLNANSMSDLDTADSYSLERDEKVARRNQVLYAVAWIDEVEFRYSDIEAYVRLVFPDSFQGAVLNVTNAMSEMAHQKNGILKRTPKGNAYMLKDPLYRVCLRNKLQRPDDGEKIEVGDTGSTHL
jgi:serine/threonine protein kinase